MIAIGIDNKGEYKEFEIDSVYTLICSIEDLVSIKIPEGVKQISCCDNLLSELFIPDGIQYLECDNNLISELHIPKSMKYLCCDRNVKGLENIVWECEIILK